jgi:hypothetical protein
VSRVRAQIIVPPLIEVSHLERVMTSLRRDPSPRSATRLGSVEGCRIDGTVVRRHACAGERA